MRIFTKCLEYTLNSTICQKENGVFHIYVTVVFDFFRRILMLYNTIGTIRVLRLYIFLILRNVICKSFLQAS